jgi:hypothetical protein
MVWPHCRPLPLDTSKFSADLILEEKKSKEKEEGANYRAEITLAAAKSSRFLMSPCHQPTPETPQTSKQLHQFAPSDDKGAGPMHLLQIQTVSGLPP